MIVEAINKRTGKPVKIKDARYGQRFACPYCSADMHPVLKAPNPFFRCNEGEKHKHYLCVQLDEPASKAYDPKRTDIEELFANLFRPVKEYNPPVLPPNNRNKPEKKPETGRVGTEPGEDAGGAVNDEPSTGFVEEPNEGEDDTPPEPVILPCRTLRQLWKAGISNFKSYERIGSYLRSDIFLWFVDFDRFLACHESLKNAFSLSGRVGVSTKPMPLCSYPIAKFQEPETAKENSSCLNFRNAKNSTQHAESCFLASRVNVVERPLSPCMIWCWLPVIGSSWTKKIIRHSK